LCVNEQVTLSCVKVDETVATTFGTYKNKNYFIHYEINKGSLGVKRPGSEADHSPPSCGEVKEFVELYLHSLNTSLWRGA
jgi:hypothetical protein